MMHVLLTKILQMMNLIVPIQQDEINKKNHNLTPAKLQNKEINKIYLMNLINFLMLKCDKILVDLQNGVMIFKKY